MECQVKLNPNASDMEKLYALADALNLRFLQCAKFLQHQTEIIIHPIIIKSVLNGIVSKLVELEG